MIIMETFLAIDVECVGCSAGDISTPCSVAVTDLHENELVNCMINCTDVTDYRTNITGLEVGSLSGGISFEDARKQVLGHLGPKVILVGQSIENDIAWLKLVRGTHYLRAIDLAEKFEKMYDKGKKTMRFTLRAQGVILLGLTFSSAHHSAIEDAKWSMQLFREFLQSNGKKDKKRIKEAQHKLYTTPKAVHQAIRAGRMPDAAIVGAQSSLSSNVSATSQAEPAIVQAPSSCSSNATSSSPHYASPHASIHNRGHICLNGTYYHGDGMDSGEDWDIAMGCSASYD